MSDNFELEQYLGSLPGIGPRQAKRIVYSLLRKSPHFSERLGDLISKVKKQMHLCQETYHYFYSPDPNAVICPIAADSSRDHTKVMIVETDSDLENIENSGIWRGTYFVLGGSLKPNTPTNKYSSYIRLNELNQSLSAKCNDNKLNEIVLGLSATVNGDFTGEIISDLITKACGEVKISHLARGISTGSSLEYLDKNTLQNAIEHRE